MIFLLIISQKKYIKKKANDMHLKIFKRFILLAIIFITFVYNIYNNINKKIFISEKVFFFLYIFYLIN